MLWSRHPHKGLKPLRNCEPDSGDYPSWPFWGCLTVKKTKDTCIAPHSAGHAGVCMGLVYGQATQGICSLIHTVCSGYFLNDILVCGHYCLRAEGSKFVICLLYFSFIIWTPIMHIYCISLCKSICDDSVNNIIAILSLMALLEENASAKVKTTPK
jgi:hypothetical protein